MSFLINLVLVLITAKAFGELAERLKYPSVLGYLAAGLLLGPAAQTMLGATIVSAEDPGIMVFGQLGAILILFLAGLREVNVKNLMENKIATIGSAFLGYLLPFSGALFLATQATAFGVPALDFAQTLLLVTAVSCSSVITTLKTLLETGRIKTIAGKTILSSAILGDTAGLLIFTLVLSYISVSGMFPYKFMGVLLLAVIFAVIFLVGERLIPILVEKTSVLEVEEAQFTVAFIVMLALAYLASLFGFHGIIGAFLAGLIIAKTSLRNGNFAPKISSLAYGIFVPIFFAWIGMLFTPIAWEFSLALLLVVVAANMMGAGIGAWLGNVDAESSASISLGMIPRGGIDLVVIAAGYTMGFLSGAAGQAVLSSVILLAVITMLITPPLLRTLTPPEE
ncbi:MAG: cation:proton antiporter [Candidatus Diapherotrites archaeon]|nr:cation:proton antiporter [Candidatus Diapherotrites archaeon]